MSTPLDLQQLCIATAASKVVAALTFPAGLVTPAGATINGGSVTGTPTIPTGASAVYLGLVESPSTFFGAFATIAGTDLPDSTTQPYTIEARVVAGGTDMATYSAIASAFAAATSAAALVYTRDVPATMIDGMLVSGAWGRTISGGGAGGGATAEEIADLLAGFLAGGTIHITAPVDVTDDDRLTLIQGDDHTLAGRVPAWTIENYSGPSLVASTGKLRLLDIKDYRKRGANAAAVLEVTATVSQVATTVTVTAPITGAQSALLATYPPGDETTHEYHLVATTSGAAVVTLKLGPVTVRRRIDAP